MQKVNWILFLFIFFTSGCTTLRKAAESSGIPGETSEEEIRTQNLTEKNFFISKAEIEIASDEGKEKIFASIKFRKPADFLISLKNRVGIEAARIYMTSDTLLINDRINRKMYYGKPSYLELKYGIPSNIFPVIFGDFISNNVQGKIEKCNDKVARFESYIKGFKMLYYVDCRRRKLTNARIQNSTDISLNEIDFGKFIKRDDITYPSVIIIQYSRPVFKISVKIAKIERPWEGNIEMIPGSRYELIELR